MKKLGIIFIMLFLLFSIIAKETELVILHTNDFHGHPLKFENSPAKDVGGLPAIATFVKETRSQYKNVLLLDAGDINTGRPESNFFKTEPDIIGYNYIRYDAMVLGNHEFDHSIPDLKNQMKLAKFPFISANVYDSNGKLLTKPYIIKNYNGIKVGIFGLTTTETTIVGNPEYTKGLKFEDEVETAKKMVNELKGKVNIIIAVVHMGLYDDENQGSKKIAKNVEGIDLIIDGHTHSNIDKPFYINNIPIVQAWNWGLIVGKGIFKINEKKEVIDFTWEAVPINLKKSVKKADGTVELQFIGKEYKEDQELLTQLKPYGDKVDAVLSQVIGKSEGTFSNANVRKAETELGDLVSDAMLWLTKNLKVDFAIQNGGGIRTDLPEGDIKKKSIYSILPFDNSIVVLNLKGSDVIELFNFIGTIENGKGAFPQVSDGVSFTINYETKTCENVLINGNPIDPNKEYVIATNSFMASGGDGYAAFKKAVKSYDTSAFQRDALIDYIIHIGGKIKPEIKNRIKIINKSQAYLFDKNILINLAA